MTDRLKYFFLIALILHLLLCLSFSLRWQFLDSFTKENDLAYQPYDPNLQRKEFTVLPAYMAKESVKKTAQTEPNSPTPKSSPTSKDGIEKPKPEKTVAKSSDSSSLQYTASTGNTASSAEKTYDDELMKILHEETGKKLIYPRMASDFRVRGTVYVRFLIAPNGQVSRVSIIKSSGFGPYDNSAFTAISNLSPVRDAGKYLSKPKYVTAMIVFD
jgi:TonB family protein